MLSRETMASIQQQ